MVTIHLFYGLFISIFYTALHKHCPYAGIESFDHVLLRRSSSSGSGSNTIGGAVVAQWRRHQIHIISTAATVDLISRCCRPIHIVDLRITGNTGTATRRQSLWQHYEQCQRQWQQWPTAAAATATSATTTAAASASVASSGVKQRQ